MHEKNCVMKEKNQKNLINFKYNVFWLAFLLRIAQSLESRCWPGWVLIPEKIFFQLILVGRIYFLVVVGLRSHFLAGCKLGLLPGSRDHLHSLPSDPLHLQASNGASNHFCTSKLWLPFLLLGKMKQNKNLSVSK